MYTQMDAVKVAQHLVEVGNPNEVEVIGLIGSIARTGRGNDIDIIVFTEHPHLPKMFAEHCKLQRDEFERKHGHAPDVLEEVGTRRTAVKTILELDSLTPEGMKEEAVDVWVYPFHGDYQTAMWEMDRAIADSSKSTADDLLFFSPEGETFFCIQ